MGNGKTFRKQGVFWFLFGIGICRYFDNKIHAINRRKLEISANRLDILERLINLKNNEIQIKEHLERMGDKKVAIYGLGMIGNYLYEELKNSNMEIIGIDKSDIYNNFQMKIYKPENHFEDVDVIIVTPVLGFKEICENFSGAYHGTIISCQQLLKECESYLYKS